MSTQANLEIFILTGPIHSGKSTSLVEWVTHNNSAGFITPEMMGKKVFMDIATQKIIPYELKNPSTETISVGPYHLNKNSFIQATHIFELAKINNADWFVMDEIGKLELEQKGHHSLLKKVLNEWNRKLLLVVRNTLLNIVLDKYGLSHAKLISKEDLKNN